MAVRPPRTSLPRAGRLLLGCALIAAAGLLRAASLPAAGPGAAELTLPNWAGYVVAARAGPPLRFRRVSGTWRVPAVRCRPAQAGSAAVWVGLGGLLAPDARRVEQIGSESACSPFGRPRYYGWFEISPYQAFPIGAPLRAGDVLAASVASLPGARVGLALADRTRHWRFARQISFFGEDASSADWVVAVHSTCRYLTCVRTRLPDFGTVRFSRLSAAAGTRIGTLTDSAWRPLRIRLVPAPAGPGLASPGATAGAVAADGSFTVTWRLAGWPGPPTAERAGRLARPGRAGPKVTSAAPARRR
jgi:hypothetical protein